MHMLIQSDAPHHTPQHNRESRLDHLAPLFTRHRAQHTRASVKSRCTRDEKALHNRGEESGQRIERLGGNPDNVQRGVTCANSEMFSAR